MLLAFLQLRDAKMFSQKKFLKNQEAVKLINSVKDAQYVASYTCDHLGIMTCPLLVFTCGLFP